MTTLPAETVTAYLAVLRRCCVKRTDDPAVRLCPARGGAALEAWAGGVGVRLAAPGPTSAEALALAASDLAACLAPAGAAVTFHLSDAGRGLAAWPDAEGPREHGFAALPPEAVPPWPGAPARSASLPGEFLRALAAAAQCTAKEDGRYALTAICLRGQAGEVAGSDAKQLLRWGGFAFPWPEDLLVPRLPAAASKELGDVTEVRVGRREGLVLVAAGPWQFALPVRDGRYPDVEQATPPAAGLAAVWRLEPAEAAALAAALPRLPGSGEEFRPVTLELGRGGVAARARDEATGAVVEVRARAEVRGRGQRAATDRRLLARALALAPGELWLAGPDQPLALRGGARTYVWMPLGAAVVVPPATGARVIELEPRPAEAPSAPAEAEQEKSMNGATNGHAPGRADEAPGAALAEALAEAEALREVLAGAARRAARLAACLRQHKQQGKALAAAMASLRRLGTLEP